MDSAIGFPYTYPLDSDLSGGERYPVLELLGPGHFTWNYIPCMLILKEVQTEKHTKS